MARGSCAIVLAAGKGTRMKSDRVKVLHEVAGRPLLAFVLDAVRAAGISNLFVVVGYQHDEVTRSFEKGRVKWVKQKVQRGTADAVLACMPALRRFRGSTLVLAGDVPLIQPEGLRQLMRFHEKWQPAATVLTMEMEDPSGYGRILRGSGNSIEAIREELDASAAEKAIREVNSGIYVFDRAELAQGLRQVGLNRRKKEFYLTDIVEKLNASGKFVLAFKVPDAEKVQGVNTRYDLAEAEKTMQDRVIRYHTEHGVTVVQPQTTYIADGVCIGQDTVIHPFSYIESGVRIGRRCQIGPFSRLRKGTQVEDGAVIGSFVEVTRSRVGKGTLVKHLSYIGDARLGKKVNVGAGTITANFDGVRKCQTVVEDGAFLGVHTSLVAPVRVGRGAKTGAGAVVLKKQNVPPHSLVVGVPAHLVQKSARKKTGRKKR